MLSTVKVTPMLFAWCRLLQVDRPDLPGACMISLALGVLDKEAWLVSCTPYTVFWNLLLRYFWAFEIFPILCVLLPRTQCRLRCAQFLSHRASEKGIRSLSTQHMLWHGAFIQTALNIAWKGWHTIAKREEPIVTGTRHYNLIFTESWPGRLENLVPSQNTAENRAGEVLCCIVYFWDTL